MHAWKYWLNLHYISKYKNETVIRAESEQKAVMGAEEAREMQQNEVSNGRKAHFLLLLLLS